MSHKVRPVLSFGRRRGRKLTPAKENLVEQFLPRVSVALPEAGTLDFDRLYNQSYDRYALEIGFGSGEHLAAQAQTQTNTGFIGCEPYVNGFTKLLAQMQDDRLSNVRLYTDDARTLIARLPDASLDTCYILFPDPWPKARHHKRRLINQDFLPLLARAMKPGARLLIATDHADYLTWILENMLAAALLFGWQAKGPEDWKQPPEGWVKTRYQQKAEKEGRSATFLEYIKI